MNSTPDTRSGPALTDRSSTPEGVLQKNLKMLIYIGAVSVLILASVVSSFKKKPAAVAANSKGSTVSEVAPDSTANNIATMHAQAAADRQSLKQEPAPPTAGEATPATGAYGPTAAAMSAVCMPGQVCPPTSYGSTGQAPQQQQVSPEQQEAQQLAVKERERLYASRFASNIAWSHPEQQQGSAQAGQNPYASTSPSGQPSNLTPAKAAGEQAQPTYKRSTEVNVDSATGQPYVIYEGLTLDTVLINRLNGDAAGPVKVLVSNPVYSHDHQHVLIPEGTVVLGEARKIGAAGFGQQRRVAVVFHRMLMPDGYSVDLDQFHGLDQIGEEGLKDQVNNHYLQIFGTSIALGVISGAAQITQGGSGYNSTGSQSFVNGAAAGTSQQATTIMDRFIQIPPTMIIREGHRVKVYFTQDMLLPAYTSHTIPQTF